MGYITANTVRLWRDLSRCTRAYQPTKSPDVAFDIRIARKQPTHMHLARSITSSTTRRAGKTTVGKQAVQQQSTKYTSHKTVEIREAALQAVEMRRAAETKTKMQTKKARQKEYQKRYNSAARKWVSTMIALPILLVTSYHLFDRLALGNGAKTLSKVDTNSSRLE